MLVPSASHHIGCALDIVEILVYLYFDFLNVYPKKPNHPNRDIFILSKGHAASALYAVLVLKGFFPKKVLLAYDQNGGTLPEHASRVAPGVELSTGSLGHGLPVGTGFALAAKNDKSNKKIVVLMSDGELDEGSNWESIMFAAHHKLNNLIAIIDKNDFQGYASTDKVLNLSPLLKKFEVFGWEGIEIDGHDFSELKNAFKRFKYSNDKPKVVICNTIKGKGVSIFEGKFESHYKSLSADEKQEALKELEGQK